MNPVLYDLPKFRQLSKNTYQALCPVHDEKSASLHITDKGDCVLMHCFGCGANGKEVCEALGIDPMEVLFEKTFKPVEGKIKHKISARDILTCLRVDVLTLNIYAQKINEGKEYSKEKLSQCTKRIMAAAEYE